MWGEYWIWGKYSQSTVPPAANVGGLSRDESPLAYLFIQRGATAVYQARSCTKSYSFEFSALSFAWCYVLFLGRMQTISGQTEQGTSQHACHDGASCSREANHLQNYC